jgi:hypothetical protein
MPQYEPTLVTGASATVHWNKQFVDVAVYLAHAAATLRKFVYRLVHLDE